MNTIDDAVNWSRLDPRPVLALHEPSGKLVVAFRGYQITHKDALYHFCIPFVTIIPETINENRAYYLDNGIIPTDAYVDVRKHGSFTTPFVLKLDILTDIRDYYNEINFTLRDVLSWLNPDFL